MRTLSKGMTLRQFDHGYRYATEVKTFAQALGVRAAHAEGRARESHQALPDPRQRNQSDETRSVAVGRQGRRPWARPRSAVVLYTNDHETKAVLEREARTLDPSFTRRSGSRYRLNRWREPQLTRGARITYRDLVKEDVRLNRPETTYRRVPVGRYCNFLDFMAENPGATMAAGIRARRP